MESQDQAKKQAVIKPLQVQRTHDKIKNLYGSNADLKQTEGDLQSLASLMNKMPMKYDQGNVTSTMDQLFEIAQDKMESDKDKAVLKGLRQMVGELESSYYRPQPRF